MTGVETAPPWLVEVVTDVPDFPKPGILFKDLNPLWASPSALSRCAIALAQCAPQATIVAGIEARGFLAGLAVAQRLGVGFVPIRKAGKMPPPVHSVSYDLEYGQDTLELQHDAVSVDDKVMVVDDVLATGGTAAATVGLIESAGANVITVATILELTALNGRSRLDGDYAVRSLWQVPG